MYDPFPPTLVLTPHSRNPIALPDDTVRTVLEKPLPAVPVASGAPFPRVSIVIVTFNKLVFNRMCLESVLANTDSSNYEIIVVDNGSTDETVTYLRELSRRNTHVRIVANDRNRGFAAASNQGLSIATGEVLVLLNNDTIVPPHWLEDLIRHLKDLSVGLVGPVTNRIGNEAEIPVDYKTYGQFLECAAEIRRRHARQHFEIETPYMFCLALRRDAYEQIGPLDEQFEVGMFEDNDYAVRAREAGYRLVCAEDVFVHHFGQASFGDLVPTGQHARLLAANKQRFEAKWGRSWQPPGRRKDAVYEGLKQEVRSAVASATPVGSTILVVGKGDEDLLELIRAGGRSAWHFPQAADGSYAGHYPSDAASAISHFEELRGKGADFILFPSVALWWLDYYKEFGKHLAETYSCVARDSSTCWIYGLYERG